jgi:regulator of sigma E protease
MSLMEILTQLPFLIAGLLGFSFLIGFHELGHFLFCKLFGIRTPSFSIGFGPVLFKKRFWDTDFVLSALPFGGFVEIAGSAEVGQGNQVEAFAQDEGSFARKPYYQKMLVISGGILFNMLFAYATLSTLYYIGMPQTPLLYMVDGSTKIDSVVSNSPAEKAGIVSGDTIVAIDGLNVKNVPLDLIGKIRSAQTDTVSLEVERDSSLVTVPVTLETQTVNGQETKYLGTTFASSQPNGLIDSIRMGIKSTNKFAWLILDSFKKLFKSRSVENVGGPIMILSQTIKAAQHGIGLLMLFLAFISINLAVLNVIPLPILDGGQALFHTIEAIIRRPLSPKLREYIFIACWLMFIVLFLYLSVKDTIMLWNS